MNFAKFVITRFLQNTTGRLLLIIVVSIVMKGELANKTVNYDTKFKHMYQFEPEVEVIKKGQPWLNLKPSFTDFLQSRCS